MADYFFILDAAGFEERTRPVLGESWRLRSFRPAVAVCAWLLPAARDYAERYHTGAGEPLLARVAAGTVPFDRTLWRALIGEVLLFSAVEIPEFQVNAETLTCLLAPRQYVEGVHDRTGLAPVQQALSGSRDLTFGTAVYRPEHAGLNTADDVERLARYLGAIRPETWTAEQLEGLKDIPAEDHADEVAFAREWFPALAGMYGRAAEHGQIIVHESIF